MDPWKTKQAATFWNSELESYGKSAYVDGVLDLIRTTSPKAVFELSVGNGRSFAGPLSEEGTDVHGCDISDVLIDELHELYPNIEAYSAGYEDFSNKEEVDTYDVTYCVRSSWYFSDIYTALDNMISITKPGGMVIIDIMNADAISVKKGLSNLRKKKMKQWVKNKIKLLLNLVVKNTYKQDVIFRTDHPVRPALFEAYLDNHGLTYEKLCFEQITGKESSLVEDSIRYLYRITKS
jgi:SAM-dependent methyltransferase